MAKYKDTIMRGKQAEQPATPSATPMVEQQQSSQQTQPQAEQDIVKSNSIASSGIDITPEETMQKQRESFVNNSTEAAKKEGYDKIAEQIATSNKSIENDKRAEIEEKRRNRARIFNAIGDGVAALANVYFASKGAPAVNYNDSNSLSAKTQARWDKLDALRREDEQKQYLRDKEKREQEARIARYEAQERRYNQEQADLQAHRKETLAQNKEKEEQRRKDEERRHIENLAAKKEIEQMRQEGQNERNEANNARAIATSGKKSSNNTLPFVDSNGEQIGIDKTTWETNKMKVYKMLESDGVIPETWSWDSPSSVEVDRFIKKNWAQSKKAREYMHQLSKITPATVQTSELKEDASDNNNKPKAKTVQGLEPKKSVNFKK